MSDDTPARVTNLVDLLDQLIPPAEPKPIPMTPQTAGWAVLLVCVLGALAYAGWRFLQHWRRNAYRRAALAALQGAGQDAAAIALILRRSALAAYPRTEVAGLSGEDWLSFLDRTGRMTGFRDGPGVELARAPYAGDTVASPDLVDLARRWITGHRGGVGG